MPNSDPPDGYFYPALTLVMDSYNLTQAVTCGLLFIGCRWGHHVRLHLVGIKELLGSLFLKKINGEQEKESFICVRVGKKNLFLRIAFCHHSASLVIPSGDHQDGLFYNTLILMIDS